ncbi:hypothetical protein F4813DRAFT_174595 [Daldinia decipiens]|uniref:uncharacterized protein n=1 Tax=Daldinia decipiens TaxID=326647 RepID=UPI0020C485F7|nr:uncharacterized protein F4813DRAFT_174595 [Daldinia decipiens]KAI1661835.1 hypothetical protein F4813DRAFT_174595 [Daldinia decipiens]
MSVHRFLGTLGTSEALLALGLVWVMQPPENQRIPPFWQKVLELAKTPKTPQHHQHGGKTVPETIADEDVEEEEEEEENHENDREETPPSAYEHESEPERIVIEESDDSNTEDLQTEIDAMKESINNTLEEILANQKLIIKRQQQQGDKLAKIEEALQTHYKIKSEVISQ